MLQLMLQECSLQHVFVAFGHFSHKHYAFCLSLKWSFFVVFAHILVAGGGEKMLHFVHFLLQGFYGLHKNMLQKNAILQNILRLKSIGCECSVNTSGGGG